MSSPFEFQAPSAPSAGGYAPAAAAPAAYIRHPLGLPAGSVRALLTFMILGTIWALLLIPAEKGEAAKVPLYLSYLMFLVIGSYFGARGSAPNVKGQRESPPLYLPRGTIRFLIIFGFLGAFGYAFYRDNSLFSRLKFDVPTVDQQSNLPLEQKLLPFIILGAYMLGSVISTMAGWVLMGEEGMPAWYQDIQAWIAVLAVLALTGGVIYQLIIFPTISPEKAVDLKEKLNFPWQSILSGIVAFYFGAR